MPVRSPSGHRYLRLQQAPCRGLPRQPLVSCLAARKRTRSTVQQWTEGACRGQRWRADDGLEPSLGRLLAEAVQVVGRQIDHLSLQVLDFEMGVALGGGHPGVAQQFLHRSQVGPGAQGMGGEGVAQ